MCIRDSPSGAESTPVQATIERGIDVRPSPPREAPEPPPPAAGPLPGAMSDRGRSRSPRGTPEAAQQRLDRKAQQAAALLQSMGPEAILEALSQAKKAIRMAKSH
eukprot:13916799-Alexandrium_andersonii.AAC.1